MAFCKCACKIQKNVSTKRHFFRQHGRGYAPFLYCFFAFVYACVYADHKTCMHVHVYVAYTPREAVYTCAPSVSCAHVGACAFAIRVSGTFAQIKQVHTLMMVHVLAHTQHMYPYVYTYTCKGERMPVKERETHARLHAHRMTQCKCRQEMHVAAGD